MMCLCFGWDLFLRHTAHTIIHLFHSHIYTYIVQPVWPISWFRSAVSMDWQILVLRKSRLWGFILNFTFINIINVLKRMNEIFSSCRHVSDFVILNICNATNTVDYINHAMFTHFIITEFWCVSVIYFILLSNIENIGTLDWNEKV